MTEKRNNMKKVILIIGGILLLVAGYVAGNLWHFSWFKNNGGTACTMEVKLCPDGSYVTRVAPKCDFTPCPAQKGILRGKVSIGPLCPVEPCPGTTADPYTSRKVLVSKQTAELLFSIPILNDGTFGIEIPTGTYVLDLSDCVFLGCQRSLPKSIKIEAGKVTEINIDIDTGIR